MALDVKVQVTLDAREPETHLVRVTQRFPATDAPRRTFRMAAWVPGSYKIRDFGRHVQDVEATVGGTTKAVRQEGKDAWTVPATAGKVVELRFRVYCRELTVDTSHVTSDHAHLFPATLVLYDDDSRSLPHAVRLHTPRGWKTWSGLETDALDGTLRDAEDYDHLIDCPLEAGPEGDYAVEAFQARGKTHRIVLWKPPEGMDGERIRRDFHAIVGQTAKVFGGLPFDHYTFLGHVAMDHGGGLEHRNSTVLGIDPLHLLSAEKIQRNLLPLVAHEFFHTWTVKRILPAAFTPYDLQTETYTDLLWLFEGFTTYYELPLLARAGVVTREDWGKFVAEMLKYYEMALGRKHLSVAAASRLTWTLLYQPHEHNINRNVSYYTKGLWVGLCLDAHLRHKGHTEGLDVVMRSLWERFGKTGTGLAEDGLAAVVKEATGEDVAALLGRWVNGTTELPIETSLARLGWSVQRDHEDPKKAIGLGVHFKTDSSVIERIPEDSPAWRVLQPDDELVAVGGYKWKPGRFADLATTLEPGDRVPVSVFREGRLRSFDVPVRELPKSKITVTVRKGDAAATRRRRAWLGQGWLETSSK